MFIANAWYQRLYDILNIVSGKTTPSPPPTQPDVQDTIREKSMTALTKFADYFSANGAIAARIHIIIRTLTIWFES